MSVLHRVRTPQVTPRPQCQSVGRFDWMQRRHSTRRNGQRRRWLPESRTHTSLATVQALEDRRIFSSSLQSPFHRGGIERVNHPVSIVGGGLAGLSLGINLRRHGIPVHLYETNRYPRHKVCGEFISGSGIASLDRLALTDLLFDPFSLVPGQALQKGA